MNELAWGAGEVLQKLKSLGIENDTLVIFTSDHGPYRAGCTNGGSPGQFWGGKGDTYEGAVRVPGIAWWPGTIKPKTTTHATVNLMDIFPTALELAGLCLIEVNYCLFISKFSKVFQTTCKRKIF